MPSQVIQETMASEHTPLAEPPPRLPSSPLALRIAWERWSQHWRWPFLSIIVGIIAGLGAILFEESLRWTLKHFLSLSTGFQEPGGGRPAPSWWPPSVRCAPGCS